MSSWATCRKFGSGSGCETEGRIERQTAGGDRRGAVQGVDGRMERITGARLAEQQESQAAGHIAATNQGGAVTCGRRRG
jgi:hypothetical protein